MFRPPKQILTMKLHLLSTLQGLKNLKNNDLIRKAKKISFKQLFIISQKTLTFQTSLTQYTKINRQTKKKRLEHSSATHQPNNTSIHVSHIPYILHISFLSFTFLPVSDKVWRNILYFHLNFSSLKPKAWMCFSFPSPLPACFSRSRVAATAWPFISSTLKQYKNAVKVLN